MSFFSERALVERKLSKQTLIILSIIFFLALLTFIWLMLNVINSETFLQVDTLLINSLYEHRTVSVAQFFLGVTFLGSSIFVIATAIIFSVYYLLKKQIEHLALFITLTGTHETISILKPLIDRDRPDLEMAYYIENSLSFPSGHSAIAVALFGYFIYYIFKITVSQGTRIIVILASVTLILLIGFSRMYLGVHHLTDVVGGYLIGLLWLIIGIISSELLLRNRESVILMINKSLSTIKKLKK